MSQPIDHTRRRLIQSLGLGILAAGTFPRLIFATGGGSPRPVSPNFHPDVDVELTARPTDLPLFKGPRTHVWKFFGQVLKGPENCLTPMSGSYLGPLLRFRRGQRVRIRFRNELPEDSVVHWHGLHVPAVMDGHPMYAIGPGETFAYEFEILNRAGTYWYHPHPHWVTAKHVYRGLAGMMLVEDEEEMALGLPSGAYELPIVIQDRSLDRRNQFQYSSHMMTRMRGFLGNRIIINGTANATFSVATRVYRLRVLNGSNSRIYKLGWDDGSPLIVIGNDGGLLERPESRPFVMLAPGERIDVWVDFKGHKLGSERVMRSLPFTTGHGMMGGMGGRMMGGMRGGGMMSGSVLPLGSDYPLFRFRITRQESGDSHLPTRLSSITPLRLGDAANSSKSRTITLSMRHMSALLNGLSYGMDDVAPWERIPLNTLQIIEFDNGFGVGHGMRMPHPMHIHGEPFQIIKRSIHRRFGNAYETVSAGLLDSGWKDTVLVMPGEKVTLLKRFDDFKGRFMYHCHNLEHEDLGMMRDFLVY